MSKRTNGPERLNFRVLPLSGFFYALLLLSTVTLLSGCGVFATRPARHLGYAEAAFQAAEKANAETNAPQSFQLARETLFRARAAFRLKNFKRARKLAVRARLLSEESEFRSTFKDIDPALSPLTNPPE